MSSLKDTSGQFKLSPSDGWFLLACQVLNISTLFSEISNWMLAILALCCCWHALLVSNQTVKRIFVSPIILTIFAISGCIAIAISAKTFGVLISMVHLLVFAYVLKSLEIKTRKDFYLHALLGLFLLASSVIFRQNLAFALYIVFLITLNLALLHKVFNKAASIKQIIKVTSVLLLQSSLLAIVLFIVFPRLSPFWQVPMIKSAKTGLSNEVSPGDIANLALSSELAFRVNFQGNTVPRYSSLYWRAMTMEHYDGRKWLRGKNIVDENTNKKEKFKPYITGDAIKYHVIAQPSYDKWLFALSVGITESPQVILKDDYTVQHSTIVNQRFIYEVSSYPDTPLSLILSEESKKQNLMIPVGTYPRLEQLALTLKNKHIEPKLISAAVLNNFRTEQYYYTLQPPLLKNNSLEQFYFETKAGFCVYYASSYTYIMRAAGIPARIVTGYLGGEYNKASSDNNDTQGGHLNIYQYDAHAWSEIWIEGIGWYRVDPTAAVDPERVENGWSNDLLEQQSVLSNEFFSLYRLKNIAWLNSLRLQLDAIDYQWTRLILSYSPKQQYDLLKRWFGKDVKWKATLTITLVIIITMLSFALVLYLLNKRRLTMSKTPTQIMYEKCLSALGKKGLVKHKSQTMLSFTRDVERSLHSVSKLFHQITIITEQINYQELAAEKEEKLIGDLKTKTSEFLAQLKRL